MDIEDAKLVVKFGNVNGRGVSLNRLHKDDIIVFEWEEYHCGDTDYESSIEITYGDLFELLTVNHTHEVQLKQLAGRELDKETERLRELCKKLGQENRRLKGVEEEHSTLLKVLAKAEGK